MSNQHPFQIGQKLRVTRKAIGCKVGDIVTVVAPPPGTNTDWPLCSVPDGSTNYTDLGWFISPAGLEPVEEAPTRRFAVGDKVRIVHLGHDRHGQIGTLVENDGSDYLPFRVKFDAADEAGEAHRWFDLVNLEVVPLKSLSPNRFIRVVDARSSERVRGLTIPVGTRFRLTQDREGVPAGAVLVLVEDDGSQLPAFRIEDATLWAGSTWGGGGRTYYELLRHMEEIVEAVPQAAEEPAVEGEVVPQAAEEPARCPKPGDRVRVVGNTNYHEFPIGTEVVVREFGGVNSRSGQPYWSCTTKAAGHHEWYVRECDMEAIPEAAEELVPQAAEEPAVEGEMVFQPAHYTRLFPEPITVINAWEMNFNRGNAVKYIARAGHKGDEVQDLEKAIRYLQVELECIRRRKVIAEGGDRSILVEAL